jgi:6-phosphogluconolactonase
VFSDRAKLADAVAADVAAWLRVDADRPTVGLAGGSTPRAAYERLRDMGLPWEGVQVWMTDERFVPHDHPDSNGRMARESLLDAIDADFHEVPILPGDPAGSAAAYEADLTEALPGGPDGIEPGLVLLGMGADGHTASLFPNTAALDDMHPGYVANRLGDGVTWRLTATIPLLAAARRTVFVVAGEDKAPAVARVLESETDDPAGLVSRASRDAVWLVDRDAAGLLWQI